MAELKWRRTRPPGAAPDDWVVDHRYAVQIGPVMKIEYGPQAGRWR